MDNKLPIYGDIALNAKPNAADAMGQSCEKGKDRLAQLDEIQTMAEQVLAERQCLTF